MALTFAFSPEDTPETVAAREAALARLASRIGSSRTIGGGVGDMLTGLAVGLGNMQAKKAKAAGMASAGDAFKALNLFGSKPAAAPAPAMPAASAPSMPSPSPAPAGNASLAKGIHESAAALGVDPVALATAISYETGGTFDPVKKGPRTQWGRHQGLIQFGEPQAKKYGVDWADPVGSQLGADGAIVKYLRDAGVKPGMGLLDVYSAINAGRVGRYGASDANNGGAPGTVADKVNNQMAGHAAKAKALMASLGITPSQMAAPQPSPQLPTPAAPVASPQPQIMPAAASPEPQMPIVPQPNPRNPRGLTTREIRQMMDKNNEIDPGRIPFLRDAVDAPRRRTPFADIAARAPFADLAPPANDPIVSAPIPAPLQAGLSAPTPLAPVASPMPAQAPAPQPVQDTGPSIEQLTQFLANPWATEQQRSLAELMLKQKMAAQDPANQLAMRKAQLEVQKLENPDPIAVGGTLLDRKTYKPVYTTPPKPQDPTANMQELDRINADRVAQGLKPYRLDEWITLKEKSGVPGQPEMGTIPQDMEVVTDPVTGARTMRPIPGSKTYLEQQNAETKKSLQQDTQRRTNDIVVQDIDRALSVLDGDSFYNPATGFGAETAAKIGGTNAANLAGLLDSVESNIALDKLNAMRQASPTGGALGSVTERELSLLSSTMGAVRRSQSEQQLRDNLNRLWNVYQETINGKGNFTPRKLSFEEGAKAADAPSTTATEVKRPATIPQIVWDEMTDEERALWK